MSDIKAMEIIKKICIIGHFGVNKNLLNGQTIKTKIIARQIIHKLGKENVKEFDSSGGKKTAIRFLFVAVKLIKKYNNIIMLPAENGLVFFTPILVLLGCFFPVKLHYMVIGGWLPSFINSKTLLKKALKKLDGIYVETSVMKTELEKMGFTNIYIVPNCKDLEIVDPNEFIDKKNSPIELCTFSRVMREKGIEDAIRAITEINGIKGENIFSLDIYGQIDSNYLMEFSALRSNFPKYIRYCGEVEFNESTSVLKKYDGLLFPTQFYTEGIPGTIIDAYAAGLPVISSRWESFSDIIDDEKSGYGYQFGCYEDLKKVLLFIADNSTLLFNMKRYCIKKAKDYIASNVVDDFIDKYIE